MECKWSDDAQLAGAASEVGSPRGPHGGRAGWILAAVGVLVLAGSALAGPAQRVISLAPSVTEIIYALGEGGRLVGVCGHCDYPAGVAALPRVGGFLSPSVEAVIAAEPDLVVAVPSPGNREAVRAIERAGVRVLVVSDRTLADLWRSIERVGEALGRPSAARRLAAQLRADLETIRRSVAGRPRPGVLLVVGHRPLIIAGGGTLQDELVGIAGGRNVGADVGEMWPQISMEVVLARRPDVIIDAAMGTEQGREALFATLAGPGQDAPRIVAMEMDALVRAGPRVVEAARALARVIHPGHRRE